MSLRDNIAAIHKEVKKKNVDVIVQGCLELIVERFFESCELRDSVTLDPFYKDYIFESNRDWDDTELSYKQRLHAHREDKKRLEDLCVKLRKFGFKCQAVATHSKVTDDRKYCFHTPYISVKL